MSNLFDPFGFSPSELSTLALLMLGSGIVGAVFVGFFLDKTRLYKCTMRVILFFTVFATIMIIVTLTWFVDHEPMFIGLCEVLGFFSTAYIPLSLSFGAELTFPLQPALVNGTLTLLGSASAFIFALVGTYMNTEGKDDHLLTPEELVEVK